ncbi:DUF1934 domain-containing protein [Paenibacillus eucommiae]|uniref:Uncharacterized beta-barrel protein YwiB (DUF1934 family) n=1 Tax=Paenibacillus eucommiae TaxID=1355755 RepID=A0ABS4J894_9BACL|nr:DUF1934 domain-containing protein [Paenibacillus eucommiae]MBP1994964.1 uncharacterized beta-barrel protein YwiB (DUF1934 family) [Paenibacillus eucommiae]
MVMTPKQRVHIRIESQQAEEQTVQLAEGELYPKGDHAYIRYEEADSGLGQTFTILKLEPDQIRIIRQGNVKSEQTFVRGEKRIGFYETVQGKLELEMHTRDLTAELIQGIGWAAWSYDLYVQGEHAGLYTIKLWIREE